MSGQPIVPDVSAFRRRFPEFNDTTDDIIAFSLEEAGLFTTTWSTPGGPIARLYLTAHIVSCAQAAAESNGRFISAEMLGRVSVKYTGLPSGVLLGDVPSTVYGRRYQQIQGIKLPSFKSIRDQSRTNSANYSFYWGWP